MLRIGTQAPDFDIRTHTGLRFRLSDHTGRKNILLFFFPRQGSWTGRLEMDAFARHIREIPDSDTALIGISNGSEADLKDLEAAVGTPVPLCVDENLAVCRNYRVLWLRSYGLRRVTYGIDKKAVIRGVAHHELLVDRHWKHVRRVLDSLREEEEIATYNRKASDL